MLAAIRAFAKSPAAVVLIGLLIISFAVFGIGDVLRNSGPDAVVKAGSRTVTSADFQREFENAKSSNEQRLGQAISTEVAAANGLDRQVLEAMANREAIGALLHKLGLRPADKLIAEQIQKIPAFFDRVSGRFDKVSYERTLAENQLTPEKFDTIIRDQLAQQAFASGLLNGLEVPRAYAALASIYGLEQRDMTVIQVSPGDVPPPTAPTDAELQTFLKENAARLTRPEFRVLTVVRFSPNDVASSITLDEAEVRKSYEFKKDTLSRPELRTLVQIPAKDAATAQKILAGLNGGQQPAAVAKSVGVDAITYDQKPQTAITDRAIAGAAFKMAAGQAQIIQGTVGQAVVKVLAILPGQTVSFEQARPMIEQEMKKDAAGEKVYAQSQAYDDAHQAGAGLTEAAAKAGVPARTLGPISKEGRDEHGVPAEGLTAKILQTAFGLPSGGESDVTEGENGDYYAVRVEKVVPPSVPPLAEIKTELTRVWMIREMGKRMQARADQIAERIKKGESPDAVAAALKTKANKVTGFNRQAASQNRQIPPDFSSKALGAKVGETFMASGEFGFLVGKIDAVHTGDPAMVGAMASAMRQQMTRAYLAEIQAATETAARNEIKVKVDYNRARTAIGLEPLPEQGKAEKKK